MRQAVIVEAIRTASGRGKMGGALSGIHPVDLLAGVLAQLVQRDGLEPGQVDDVLGGCVQQVGEQSLNLTRQAVLAAGFPESVPATTIDRQCGSSQQAAHFAAQGVIAGAYDIVIACGVESMSRVPMGTAGIGQDPFGSRMAARYPEGLVNQGVSAELIAAPVEARPRRARRVRRSVAPPSRATQAAGGFAREIVSVAGDRRRRQRRRLAATRPSGPARRSRASPGCGPSFHDPRDGRAVPRPGLADHAGQLLAADRRCVRGR